MVKVKPVRLAVFAAGLALAAPQVVGAQDPDRYIVKFNRGRGAAGQQALRAAGAQVLVPLDPQDAVAARIPAQALTGLQRNPNIEYIEPDALRYPLASDRVLPSGEIVPYGIQMVQADLVISTNEAGRKLCVIDSGYSQQHVDLKEAVTAQPTSGSGTWDQDSCGHGTHVSGTVLAIAGNSAGVVGVVPGAQMHVVKVFGNDDLDSASCSWTYASTLVAALNDCVADGADVVSMSLGGSARSRTEETAFSNANKNGVLNIAAAGNAGSGSTAYPAGYKSVVSVAAVDSTETVAAFSQRNRDVEIAAPGVGVLSTVPWLPPTVAVAGGPTFEGVHVENAARANANGTIVNGGLCDSVGAWAGLVVLCQRGSISFADKVTNVQNGGGAAAMIYNNEPGGFAATLGAGGSSTIPAISISQEDGQAIVSAHLSKGATVTDTFQTGSGYESWNGTSMSTPHVSGVAALVWSCHPAATNTEIRNALNATAKDKGAAGRDTQYGYGIVQAKAAVEYLGPSPLCTTTTVSKY